MAFNFAKFSERVLKAVKGRLGKEDVGKLERLFRRVKKRNRILAAGMLSALRAGGASKRDIAQLANLLEKANERIEEGKRPFTLQDERALHSIFKSANLPLEAEKRLKSNVKMDKDDMLAAEIATSLQSGVPVVRVPFLKSAAVKPAKLEPPVEHRPKKGKRKKAAR